MADLAESRGGVPRHGSSAPARAGGTTGRRCSNTQRVLFHLQILRPARARRAGQLPSRRLAGVTAADRAQRWSPTWTARERPAQPRPSPAIATRLAHFGRFLAETDPGLASLAHLDRCRHIEPYPASHDRRGQQREQRPADHRRRPVPAGPGGGRLPHRHHRVGLARRTRRGSCCSAPTSPGCPGRCPATCPSTPTGGSPRRCAESPATELAADALRLQRACGLRIGELLDLELDCVHEVPGSRSLAEGAARQAGHRADGSAGRGDPRPDRPDHRDPLPGPPDARTPATGRPAQFLFTHHGRRLSQNAVRDELDRAAAGRRARPRHPPPAQAHLCHRPGQRRRVTASTDGAARARVRGDEPALRRGCSTPPSAPSTSAPSTLAKQRARRAARRPHRPAARRHHQRRRTGKTAPPSSPGWPADSACAPPPRAPAPTPTSASTARASAPTPPTCPSSPPSGSTPGHSPTTPKPAAGSPKPTATASSSPASTPSSARHKPDDQPRHHRPASNKPAPSSTEDGQPVTFTAVAARARISRATLYRNPALARSHRRAPRTAQPKRTPSPDSPPTSAHLRTALEAVASRVRRHEEQLRQLKGQEHRPRAGQ